MAIQTTRLCFERTYIARYWYNTIHLLQNSHNKPLFAMCELWRCLMGVHCLSNVLLMQVQHYMWYLAIIERAITLASFMLTGSILYCHNIAKGTSQRPLCISPFAVYQSWISDPAQVCNFIRNPIQGANPWVEIAVPSPQLIMYTIRTITKRGGTLKRPSRIF